MDPLTCYKLFLRCRQVKIQDAINAFYRGDRKDAKDRRECKTRMDTQNDSP
jgi:hypothetical protein